MSFKKILMVCGLSVATLVCGCSVSPSMDTTKDTQETVDTQVAGSADVMMAYRAILEASPAIEGEPDEIYDAGFSEEDNLAMFGDHIDDFALADLNQDGIPELLTLSTINFRWVPLSIYTYTDGKAVLVETFDQCSTANGYYTSFVCEENHLHTLWTGNPFGETMTENTAYVFDGTAFTMVDCSIQDADFTYYSNTAENMSVLTR